MQLGSGGVQQAYLYALRDIFGNLTQADQVLEDLQSLVAINTLPPPPSLWEAIDNSLQSGTSFEDDISMGGLGTGIGVVSQRYLANVDGTWFALLNQNINITSFGPSVVPKAVSIQLKP